MMKTIEDFYVDNYTRKVKLISRILRGDWATAEDIVQEAFARSLKFYPSYDSNRGSMDKWFNSIMFNCLHNSQQERNGVTQYTPDRISPEEVLEEVELSGTPDLSGYIAESIAQVKNLEHKRILELFFIMGYTSKEISQIEMKTSQTNVTTVVMRFRDKLKEKQ